MSPLPRILSMDSVGIKMNNALLHSTFQIVPIQMATFGGSTRVSFETFQILRHKCFAFS